MPRFIFGSGFEELGRDEGEYVILERESALQNARAYRCETWGGFSKLRGITLREVAENLVERITRQTPFDYNEIVGDWPSLPDPREVAYDHLFGPVSQIDEPAILEELEISHGSPGGHLCCIDVRSRRGILRLVAYLQDHGSADYILEEDPQLARAALGLNE